MDTVASSGSISTHHFGDKFDADKMETQLYYTIRVYPPASVRNNPNATLHLDIEKVSLKGLSSGEDTLLVQGTRVVTSHRSFNYSPPAMYYAIRLSRDVMLADVTKQELEWMPGFKVTWQ